MSIIVLDTPDGALLERVTASFGMLSAWLSVAVGAASGETVGEDESEGAIESELVTPPDAVEGTALGVKLGVLFVPSF